MVTTIYPHGAIAEQLVAFVFHSKTDDHYYLVDNAYNRMRISKEDYEDLKKKGYER